MGALRERGTVETGIGKERQRGEGGVISSWFLVPGYWGTQAGSDVRDEALITNNR